MSGFFLVHRGWRENPLFKEKFSKADAWLWLIENACYKAARHDVKGKTITVERGQLCASRDQLAKAWQWAPSAVERFLTRLQTEQMIGRESGQGKTVITICNYDKYQGQIDDAGQVSGQAIGQRSDRDRTAKEQGNKETSIKEPKGSSIQRAKEVEVMVPDWMPIDAWAGFLEMRRRIKKPATPRAQQLLIAKLEQMDRAGQNIAAVLDQSTMSNWQGIFEVKDPRNGKRINDDTETTNPYLAAAMARGSV